MAFIYTYQLVYLWFNLHMCVCVQEVLDLIQDSLDNSQ